jgi:predicted transcriptional regulator
MEELKEEAAVPIYIDDVQVNDVTVVGIGLTSISDPKKCRASIHVKGTLKALNIDDVITVGPTPVQRLVIKGRVLGRDDINNVLVLNILEMLGIPKVKIKEITTPKISTLTPDMPVRKAAKIISQGHFRGAPVLNGKDIVGMVSTVDIASAVSKGKEDANVSEIMSKSITKIDQGASLVEAIELTEKNNVSRLIVVNRKKELVGVATRTDILSRLSELSRHYFKE